MAQFRCVHDAGTGHQCFKIAVEKVEGKWLCKKHKDITQPDWAVNPPPKQRIGWPKANKNDPEEWKAYNRLYRREYRRVNPRKPAEFAWPIEIVLGWGFSKSLIWKKENKSETFSRTTYYCEHCCTEVEVTRKAAPYPKKEYNTPFSGSCYYRGKHYKVSAPHQCQRYPSSPIQYKHCDRCGTLGTKKTIKHNRQPCGWYADDLCLGCWRAMRPYYQIEREEYELHESLKVLRSTMRKAEMPVSAKAPKAYWKYDLPDYRETWYVNQKGNK
jgi:hypothetical protein